MLARLIGAIILVLSPPVICSKSIAWTRDLVQTTSNNIYFHIRGLDSKTNGILFQNFQNHHQNLELRSLWFWRPIPTDSVFSTGGRPSTWSPPGGPVEFHRIPKQHSNSRGAPQRLPEAPRQVIHVRAPHRRYNSNLGPAWYLRRAVNRQAGYRAGDS